MNTKAHTFAILLSAGLLAACISSDSNESPNPTPAVAPTPTAAPTPAVAPTPTAAPAPTVAATPAVAVAPAPAGTEQYKEDVAFLREEEKLARDVYISLHQKWDMQIVKNIS